MDKFEKVYRILDLKPMRIQFVVPSEVFESDMPNLDMRDQLRSRCTFETYYALGQFYKPKSIFEIGTRLGYSLISMVTGSGQVEKLLSWDLQGWFCPGNSIEIAKKSLIELCGYKGEAVFIIQDSQKQTTVDGFFDIAHVDADHRYECCMHDMEVCLGHCKILIIDDYKSHSSKNKEHNVDFVKPAVDDFVKKYIDLIDDHFYLDSYEGTYVIEFK
jgi:predicted O-methyltransferase YrrM